MAMVLEGTLREALREDLGGTYGVSVSASYSKIPVAGIRGVDLVRLIAGAGRRARLASRSTGSRRSRAKGPDERDVNNIREIMLREYESSSRQNGFFLREISARYQHGEDLADLYALPEFYKKLSGRGHSGGREGILRREPGSRAAVSRGVCRSARQRDANRTSASPVSR